MGDVFPTGSTSLRAPPYEYHATSTTLRGPPYEYHPTSSTLRVPPYEHHATSTTLRVPPYGVCVRGRGSSGGGCRYGRRVAMEVAGRRGWRALEAMQAGGGPVWWPASRVRACCPVRLGPCRGVGQIRGRCGSVVGGTLRRTVEAAADVREELAGIGTDAGGRGPRADGCGPRQATRGSKVLAEKSHFLFFHNLFLAVLYLLLGHPMRYTPCATLHALHSTHYTPRYSDAPT